MDSQFTIKRSRRASRLRITIERTGKVIVTIPQLLDVVRAQKFIDSKRDWILDKLAYFRQFSDVETIGKSTRREYLEYKEKARELASARLQYFNQFYNFKYTKITIRNQKTRWGSCSKRGILNFNYRIALLPPELADYLVVHELCHLKQFNHSKDFWNLVGETIPNWRVLRTTLKKIR